MTGSSLYNEPTPLEELRPVMRRPQRSHTAREQVRSFLWRTDYFVAEANPAVPSINFAGRITERFSIKGLLKPERIPIQIT